jgi:hypothetical protein
MRLNVMSLTTGLQFHGEVQGKRQHYYVLSSARQYFVMSLSLSKRGAETARHADPAIGRRRSLPSIPGDREVDGAVAPRRPCRRR